MVAKALQSLSTAGAHDIETSAKLLICQLQSMRTDKNAKKMYTDTVQAGELCLAPAVLKQRQITAPVRFRQEGTSQPVKLTMEESWCQALFEAIDLAVVELSRRFDQPLQVYIKSQC